jgi:tRNA-dihydrouridine synthase 3
MNTTIDNSTTINTTDTSTKPKGVAYIKKEYMILNAPKSNEPKEKGNKRSAEENTEEPAKKKQRGQNKNRYSTNRTSNLKKSENEKEETFINQEGELNKISHELLKSMRKKTYDYTKAIEIVSHVESYLKEEQKLLQKIESSEYQMRKIQHNIAAAHARERGEEVKQFEELSAVYVETKYKPKEIKRVDFAGKLYMAPLTTVGNLPFRRVCKDLGVDITCGEMALATNILKGQLGEMSLLRRHESEDIFGVQIAGNNIETMTKLAQLIDEQYPHIDFVDINCGCPIDLIYNQGMGTGLMEKKGKLQGIVRGMKEILRIPLTVKMRTGIQSNKLTAHKLFPQVASWGADALTLHGRTKQQRYTREADWDYIEKCASIVRQGKQDDGYKKLYVIGNGDIFSKDDYYRNIPKVDAILIGRGALIKPWIFTEIKEERHWDISSNERLELMKSFVKYGMEHYGSDEYGISTTRRFLLEWISFLHRYVPVGLLEVVPMAINERPQKFFGRNDLETLMASDNVTDWLKLTELAGLGPVSSDFKFVPKHKSNAYEGEAEAEG